MYFDVNYNILVEVFIERKPIDMWINPYFIKIIQGWKANHDIQFVMNEYACASYIVNYIGKRSKELSVVMKNACENANELQLSSKETFNLLRKEFRKAVEISAQEALYIMLNIRTVKSSRAVVFIPTQTPSEIYRLLRNHNELQTLPEDSHDVFNKNVIIRYRNRPKV